MLSLRGSSFRITGSAIITFQQSKQDTGIVPDLSPGPSLVYVIGL